MIEEPKGSKAKILRLEERLMDLVEISADYEDLPSTVFDIEIIKILDKIEHLVKNSN